MKSILLGMVSLLLAVNSALGQIQLQSPDQQVEVRINVGKVIGYSVSYNQKAVLDSSTIKLTFEQAPPLGDEMKIISSEIKSVDQWWSPVLKRKDKIQDHYNELMLELEETRFPKRKLALAFRAYNDGVAFRYVFPEQFGDRACVLMDEKTLFRFHGDYVTWAADHKNYTSSQEHEYFQRRLSEITSEMVLGLPLTLKAENCYVALTESNLKDWAGLYLKMSSSGNGKALRTQLAPLPGEPEDGRKVRFKTPDKSPWRVIMIGKTPGDLIESELVMNLADPCELDDVSWIKPGISAWDHWWSGEVQMDNETIRQYIDLASEMGWPYQLIDWQWYGPFNQDEADITTVANQLDMPAILDYAKNKNVRCILWLHSNDVHEDTFEKACALYEQWGIAGVKIDFMDRDDQEMVNWYRWVVETAAKHHLMVDFHGAYKPTGLRRALPNLVTREGVLGNEYNKWSLRVTPDHNVTLPFTRMLAGPMDFTPGGFLNRNPENFRNGTPAHVLGTRCHQLAQFVIYDSPLTVACDHPDHYRNEVGTEFLKEVSTVWDDTKVLNGEIGQYITMARRIGSTWFLASMTNSDERELVIQLDFLKEGKDYELTSFGDTGETLKNAEKAVKKITSVRKGDVVKIRMVPGGGYAAFIK